MSKDIITQYDGSELHFTDEGWINATEAAAMFGKDIYDWMRLTSTIEYIQALEEANFKTEKSGVLKSSKFVKAKKGKYGGGTWLHPKLTVFFARWLDVRFAIWCDEQISSLIDTKKNWSEARRYAASVYKLTCQSLDEARREEGKETPFYIYSNEAQLINYALTGKYAPLDRDSIDEALLKLLTEIQLQDVVLVKMGFSFADRKEKLREYVLKKQQKQLTNSQTQLTNL